MSSWLLPSVGRPNTWFCNTDLGELSRACLTSSHSSPPYLHLFSKHTQLPCPSPLCAVPLPPPFPGLYLETTAQALPLPGHPRGCIHSAALWNHPKLCITIRITRIIVCLQSCPSALTAESTAFVFPYAQRVVRYSV